MHYREGKFFASRDFVAFLKERNVMHVQVAVHSSQANGQVERINRSLVGILARHSDQVTYVDWVKNLGKVEFAINNTVNRSIGMTPSQALFGVGQRGETVDRLTEYLYQFAAAPVRDLR